MSIEKIRERERQQEDGEWSTKALESLGSQIADKVLVMKTFKIRN